MTPEEKIIEMGLSLPTRINPAANYVPFRWAGNLIFLSGQGPRTEDGVVPVGRVGSEFTSEEAYQHASIAGLNLLWAAKSAVGELSRIRAVIKLFGLVNAVEGFSQHSQVIDGCSDLFVKVLGEAGRHARSAVGTNSLPRGMTVEVEAVLLVDT